MPKRVTYGEQFLQRLVFALSKGASRKHAALYAGINPMTLATWMRLELQGDTRYYGLNDALQMAESQAVMSDLDAINSAKLDDWRAAAWKLERMYPDEYGKRTTTHHTGTITHTVDYATLSDEELDLLIAQKQAAQAMADAPEQPPMDVEYRQLPAPIPIPKVEQEDSP